MNAKAKSKPSVLSTTSTFLTFSLAVLLLTSVASADDLTAGRSAFRHMRQLNAGPSAGAQSLTESVTASWTLTPDIAAQSTGTFGIDLSHWEVDGCTVDLPTLMSNGLRYVYLEVSSGLKTHDPTILQLWQQLQPLHASKTLFRGAYHFLLPTDDLSTDATAQANNFLAAVGATNGNKPAQLSPIVDIEPTTTPVTPGTAEYDNCPRLTQDNGKYYCDMWYKMNPNDIVTLALNWAAAVKQATGQDALVYSSSGSFDQVLGNDPTTAQPLLNGRAIWMAHYTSDGSPNKDPRWPAADWNATWGMPTLLDNTPYPSPVYNVSDFWQFTATGTLSANPISCGGTPSYAGGLDLNYVPVKDAQFEAAFGIQ